jgi:TonB-linked SusC/RagA family outer membrane protein
MTIYFTKKEVFTVMKITSVQLIMAVVIAGNSLCAPVFSQELLKERVTITVRDGSLKSFLRTLEKQVDIIFSYQKDVITNDDKLNLEFKNESLDEVLKQVLTPRRIEYRVIRNNQIILSRKISTGAAFGDLGSVMNKAENALLIPQRIIDKSISGQVKTANGETLPGVSVVVKNTTQGTSTDAEGNFQLSIPNEANRLVFSFVGYLTQEIELGGRSRVDVQLEPDTKALNEVVVVGYGTQKKTTLTAAVSTMKGGQLAEIPVTNLSNGLGGRLSGVIVKQGSGEPGKDGSNIYIRGISSTGSNQPLLIVDNIPRSFQQLDPNTIESVTVLKDAAAVAPYGVAGANGVVLVTTKRGKTGAPTLSYHGYVGFQNPTVLPDFVDSYQYATLKNAAARNEKLPVPYSDYALRKFQDGSDTDAFPNWDVFKEVITPNATLTNHSFELSGGTDKVTYYASVGYQYQAGLWSVTNNQRYNISMNLDAKVTKTTKVAFNLNGRLQKAKYQAVGTDRVFELISYSHPVTPLLFSNGLPGNYTWGTIFNSGYQKINSTALYSQLSIEQELPFVPGLKMKGTIAYDPTTEMNKIWRTPVHIYTVDTTQRPYVFKDGIFEQTQPSLDQSYSQSQQLTYQASLNYASSFGKNNVGALAVFEAKANDALSLGATRRNYNLTIDEINLGSSSQADMSTSGASTMGRQMGLVYRVTYDYADKYLFEASGRYDGSYYFAPDKRFGFFPAFSAGWRISEENFMKENVRWLDNLKIRGSYGEVGALAGSAFQYLSSYAVASPAYVFGGSAVQSVNERSEPNPNITWERAKKTDVGVEATLWRGLLNVEADYFFEKRSNMLVTPDVVVPSEYGIGLSQVNAGVMQNKGIDLSVSTNYQISKDFQVSLGGNFTYAQNKLIQIFETAATKNNPNRRLTDRPLGAQFGFESQGFFQLADFDEAGNLKSGIAVQPWGKVFPGDIRYVDVNKDGKINDDDLTYIGNPGTPQIVYGISPTIRYKGLSLDLLFQGAGETDFLFYREGAWPFHGGRGAFTSHLDYWTPENPNAKNPRITSAPTTNNTQLSSFWMQDASYLRLKNATLAYNIPSFITEKISIRSARIYLSGQNILTWTKLQHYDPENGNFRGHTYPHQKVISLGLNVTF